MKLSVIIPSIRGHEQKLERTLQAYRDNTPIKPEFVTPLNYTSAGAGWAAGLDRATGDYVMLGIDDMEPQLGWFSTAVRTLEMGFIPAARVMFDDGRTDCYGSMGGGMHLLAAPDWTPCRQSPVWMATREMFDRIGKPISIHYYVDDDWFWRAQLAGYKVVLRTDFYFIHRHSADGAAKAAVNRTLEYRAAFLQHCAELSA